MSVTSYASDDVPSYFITFNDDNGFIQVANCSVPVGTSFNITPQSCLPDGATCTNITQQMISELAVTALTLSRPTWIYNSSLIICCNSIHTGVARILLIELLNFSNVPSLHLHQCHLLTTDSFVGEPDDIVLYNTDLLSITAVNKTENLNLRASALDSQFASRKMTFLSKSAFDLHAPLKAFSFIAVSNFEALTRTLLNAYFRSPFRQNVNASSSILLTEEEFMVTPVYIKP